ncbi:MAG: methyltransferase domain-containing protein [Acidobacteria bacterium]|nr:methyltransferase domain-containing protein [Acidobacteriota bacterium]
MPSPAGPSTGERETSSLRRLLAKALFVLNPAARAREIAALRARMAELEGARREAARKIDETWREIERLRDERAPRLETRADRVEDALRELQGAVEHVRDARIQPVECRLDRLELAVAEAGSVAAEVRDERLPAAVRRGDALIDRLADELEEVASLVERMLRREPLPVVEASPAEEELAAALAEIQPALVETFRGSEADIAHRLDRYLPVLRDKGPVLDLGCGRGELLVLLREAGVEATGIEGDPALAQAARRRGLKVLEGDVRSVLGQQEASSLGAVTAIHLLEHLDPVRLLEVLHEAYRVLRPGGVLIAECPNPHNLRVGASLFWLDPTHRRPLLPETLRVFLEVAGFVPGESEFLHPFPPEQRLDDGPGAGGEGGEALSRLAKRLDELLNGPRDFSLRAVKPVAQSE